MTITLTYDDTDLAMYNEYADVLADYPLYGATDGITREEIVLLAKVLLRREGDV